MPRCSLCRNVGHNKRKCPTKTQVALEPTLEPEAAALEPPAPKPEPEPQLPPLSQKDWVCAYCDLPLGNDHRPCICYGFGYSVDAWREAAIKRGRELLAAKMS